MTTLDVHALVAQKSFTLNARFTAPLDSITAVFGPSGAGKSLLLSAVAGLARSRGRIALGDRVLDDGALHVPAHARDVGLVFQDARLFPHLSVRENLSYAAQRAPRPAPVALEDAAETFAIAPLLSRSVRDLSGGERSRVALVRALLSAPALLLLDEPFAALDGPRRQALLGALDAIHRRTALPMLLVTHQIDDVARLASRVVALDAGRVVFDGALSAAALAPTFRALLAPRDVGAPVHAGQLHGGAPQTGAAWVRADAVLLASKAPDGLSARNVWEGVVKTVDDEGASRLVGVETAAGVVLSRITAEAAADLQVRPGARTWAVLKTHAL